MKNTLLIISFFFCVANVYAANGIKPVKSQYGFVENKGQIIDQNNQPNKEVLYLYSAGNLHVQLKQNSFSYELIKSEIKYKESNDGEAKMPHEPIEVDDVKFYSHRIDISFVGANPNPKITAYQPAESYLNFYTTSTSEEGVKHVQHFRKIVYQNVYPNIDVEFNLTPNPSPGEKGADSRTGFKYNIIIHPGGNVNDIKMQFNGASNTSLNERGNILIKAAYGNIEEQIPYSYQLPSKGSVRKSVDAAFNIQNPTFNIYGISVKDYNPNQTLVIDPAPWSTYFGGSGDEYGYGICRDGNGNIYGTGITVSSAGVATTGAYQTTFGGGTLDAYIVKYNGAGNLKWATYFGGTLADLSYAITPDTFANLLIAGYTLSTTGIATTGAHQTALAGLQDCFLAKFDSAGARIWGTYYGGSAGNEVIYGLTADSGSIYAGGYTNTQVASVMTTSGAYQTTYGAGAYDGFLVRFSAAGVRQWGTYYGGSGDDRIIWVSKDKNGDLLFSGQTTSTTTMTTSGAYQSSLGGLIDGFMGKFTTLGTRLWGSYYGGTANDVAFGILGDVNGAILVGGYTGSTTGIATSGAFQTTFGGGTGTTPYDVFLVKFDTNRTRQWGTYYGGSGQDVGTLGFATDALGNLYASCYTVSTGIASTGAYQTTYGGGIYDVLLLKFDSAGVRKWATYYGGALSDIGRALCLDPYGNIYTTGQTASTSGITTPWGYDTSYNGGANDSYIAAFTTNGSLTGISNNTISSSQAICSGSTPATISGSTPSGGSGSYTYAWINSVTDENSGFFPAWGTNNAINYSPASLFGNNWYRRVVISGTIYDTSAAVAIIVSTNISGNSLTGNQTICSGSTPSVILGSNPSGGNSTYTFAWLNSSTSATSGFSSASGNNNVQNYLPSSLTASTWYRRIVLSGGCVDTSSAAAITVQSPGTWRGATSTAWGTGTNWGACLAIPNSTTNVVIPSGPTNMPLITDAREANNVTIQPGASLTLNTTTSQLTIYGSLTNNGTLTNSNGTIIFAGITTQTIPAGIYHKLQVNNSAGINLSGATILNDSLILTSGRLNLGNNNLTLSATSFASAGKATSYVSINGTGSLIVQNIGSTGKSGTVLIPVGNSTFNPATLTNTGTTDNFTVKVIDSVTNAYSGSTPSGAKLTSNAVNRAWIINEGTSGGSNATITLSWAATDSLNGFDRANCYVSRFNGTNWLSTTTTTASGGNPYTQTRSGITSFSPFGVGSGGALPVELIYFIAAKRDDGSNDVRLVWVTESEQNNDYFEVEKSLDNRNWSLAGKVKGNGNTNISHSYLFADAKAALSVADILYYRLKQVDFDGQFTYSKTASVYLNYIVTEAGIKVFPNPFTDEIVVTLPQVSGNSALPDTYNFQVFDLTGRKVFEQNISGTETKIDLKNISDKGIYFLKVGDRTFKLVKN